MFNNFNDDKHLEKIKLVVLESQISQKGKEVVTLVKYNKQNDVTNDVLYKQQDMASKMYFSKLLLIMLSNLNLDRKFSKIELSGSKTL